jgi:hypothetical protein
VTRGALAIALSLLALVVGLATSLVAAHNHQRAENLVRLQRHLEMQRAANAQNEARAAAHVWSRSDAQPAPALPQVQRARVVPQGEFQP